jgi:hypothetical protein
MIAEHAGGFGEWYMPDTILVLTPLENGRFNASYSHIFVVMNCSSFITRMENGNVAIVGKGSNAE